MSPPWCMFALSSPRDPVGVRCSPRRSHLCRWSFRSFAWWYITHFRGYRKATWLGTFGVSVYSSLGAESLHPLSPVTTTMNYGVIQENGDVQVRLIYDHRVMDGATVARALGRLEQLLN